MKKKISYEELENENISLRAKNVEYRFLVDNSLDIVWTMNMKLVFTFVSPSIYEHTGFTPDEWVGSRLSEHATFIEFIKMAKKALLGLKHYQDFKFELFEAVMLHKNGSPINVEILSKVLFNDKGIPCGLVGSTRNATVRKKTEQNLIESEIKLRELNAAKDKFFSIIAHDLRSPFNSILGFSRILNEDFDKYDIDEHKKFIGIIDTGLQNTFKLLENLLLWSRSQRDYIDFTPKKVNLYLLTTEISELLKQSAENKSIKIMNKISENINIKADKYMLSTIVRNLITNAIKFTPKGGKISIDTKNKQKVVEITVRDTGVGISKEKQKKIFDIAENRSTKGTENEVGTGLGLIICRDFIEKHGGEIWVESEIEKGSIFYFTIPIYNSTK